MEESGWLGSYGRVWEQGGSGMLSSLPTWHCRAHGWAVGPQASTQSGSFKKVVRVFDGRVGCVLGSFGVPHRPC